MVSRGPLRVAFFTTDNPVGHSGIDRYTSDLLRELVKRDDLHVVPVASARTAASLSEHLPDVRDFVITKASEGIARSCEERYALGRRLERARLDVVHGTKHILPRRVPCPAVLSVYDLFPVTRRHDYRWSKRLLLPAVYRRSLAQADRVIAMSVAIRRQVVANGLARAANVAVVPAAPSTALATALAVPLAALADKPFALCVGDLSPRKNVELLLRIWPDVHRASGLVLALIGPDRGRSDVRQRAMALEQAGLVVRGGGVDDGTLRWCYEHAAVVVIPSLEEGYGLPVIEARAFGAPVITSRDPALVEVSGDGALHLDASDDHGWAEAIAGHAPRSARPTTEFSAPAWSQIAESTAAVYYECARVAR